MSLSSDFVRVVEPLRVHRSRQVAGSLIAVVFRGAVPFGIPAYVLHHHAVRGAGGLQLFSGGNVRPIGAGIESNVAGGPGQSKLMVCPSATHRRQTPLRTIWYEDIVETAFSERPVLRNSDSLSHEGRIERFKSLDRQSLEYNRTRIASVHRKKASRPNLLPERLVRLDSGNDAAQIREGQQQLRILQREIQKQKPALPLWQWLEVQKCHLDEVEAVKRRQLE